MKHEKRILLDMIVIAASMGMTLFVCICTGVFIGHSLDGFLGTTPWGLIVFSLLGAVSGFWTLYKKAIVLMKDDKPSDKNDSGK